MSAVPVFIGIDVSKGHLDMAVRPTGEQCRMVHSDSGITAVVQRVQQSQPQLIVLEATGGLEMCLASALAAAGLPVVVVNPRQVRDFSKALGQLAKKTSTGTQDLGALVKQLVAAAQPLEGKMSGAGKQMFDSFKANVDDVRSGRPVKGD